MCIDIRETLLLRGYEVGIIKVSEEKIKNKSDLYIIDLPYDMSEFIEKYRNQGAKVLTLEYFNNSVVPSVELSSIIIIS